MISPEQIREDMQRLESEFQAVRYQRGVLARKNRQHAFLASALRYMQAVPEDRLRIDYAQVMRTLDLYDNPDSFQRWKDNTPFKHWGKDPVATYRATYDYKKLIEQRNMFRYIFGDDGTIPVYPQV